jgi:hypothetical protein
LLLDRFETGRERLREFRNAESMHAALALTHGFMFIFGPVVHFLHKDSITVAYAIDAGEVELLGKTGTARADIDRLCNAPAVPGAARTRRVRGRTMWLRAVPSTRPEGLRLHGLRTFTDPPQAGANA